MLQHSLKAGLIAVVLSLVVQNANAFGHRGWGGCGRGGYGCGGYGYGGCGYSGYGGYGGCGGWYAGGGGYPGYGYGYGSYSGCGNGGCATAPMGVPLNGPAPATAPNPGMNPGAPAPGATSLNELRPDCLMIAVNLPAADAKVTINGRPTTSTGAHRTYVSSNVLVNSSYHYNLRVDFTRDGKPVTEEKTVDLSAGKTAVLTFGEPTAQVADVSTSAQR